ncbi:MAG TPA: NUDIX hydrolase [Nocardioidaceae bacterium]|nr:NUDIX hydrolase [Nocardioidaceae bacterium]
MEGAADIVAAGAVVARKGKTGREILLVHRPKYDDWSFPKGKLDPGEHVVAAAVREVAEETGLDIRLGPSLGTQRYMAGNGVPKVKDVHYWVGRVVGGDDVSTYHPNTEIDQVLWVPVADVPARLTYDYDRGTLATYEKFRKKTHALVVLRHAQARSRRSWRGDDRKRTLTKAGEFQAEHLVPLLAAFGVDHVLSSSSRRCWTTVSPFAEVADLEVEVTDDLSEEDATPERVAEHVLRLLARRENSVLCTHRPVLPEVFRALRLWPRELDPGAMLVVHHRKGRVVAVEEHDVPSR